MKRVSRYRTFEGNNNARIASLPSVMLEVLSTSPARSPLPLLLACEIQQRTHAGKCWRGRGKTNCFLEQKCHLPLAVQAKSQDQCASPSWQPLVTASARSRKPTRAPYHAAARNKAVTQSTRAPVYNKLERELAPRLARPDFFSTPHATRVCP